MKPKDANMEENIRQGDRPTHEEQIDVNVPWHPALLTDKHATQNSSTLRLNVTRQKRSGVTVSLHLAGQPEGGRFPVCSGDTIRIPADDATALPFMAANMSPAWNKNNTKDMRKHPGHIVGVLTKKRAKKSRR
ncbi:hypothetical protein EYF80_029755 [Liparis tanakae]|uniref:Uncharacterized protein n=1 Tax=Liparis tanakae TaxID=230148 RepID=A0A4Z2H278_9TELE|nr:hypothetical protein EYF80_029755 [Liparis tanakae]